MSAAAEILRRWSGAMATLGDAEECLRELAGLLRRYAGVDRVGITLRDPKSGQAVVVMEGQEADGAAGFVFQRELRGGIEDYGVLQVSARKPQVRAVELFQLLTAMERMLVHYGELEAKRAEQRRLRAKLSVFAGELEAKKIEARAVGILAAAHGVSYDEARQWVAQADDRERLLWLEDMRKNYIGKNRHVAA